MGGPVLSAQLTKCLSGCIGPSQCCEPGPPAPSPHNSADMRLGFIRIGQNIPDQGD